MFRSAVERRLFVTACRYCRGRSTPKGRKACLKTWKETVGEVARDAGLKLREDFIEYLIHCFESGDTKWLDS